MVLSRLESPLWWTGFFLKRGLEEDRVQRVKAGAGLSVEAIVGDGFHRTGSKNLQWVMILVGLCSVGMTCD